MIKRIYKIGAGDKTFLAVKEHCELGDLSLSGEVPDSVFHKVNQENGFMRIVSRGYHSPGSFREYIHPLVKTCIHVGICISDFFVQTQTRQVLRDLGDSHSIRNFRNRNEEVLENSCASDISLEFVRVQQFEFEIFDVENQDISALGAAEKNLFLVSFKQSETSA